MRNREEGNLKQDGKKKKERKDTTSVNNRENRGKQSQQGEAELPRARVPRKSGARARSQETSALSVHSTEAHRAFPSQGSRAPGVCLEEGKWEEKRQVYLAPGDSVICLFLSTFQIREAPPQPEAGPHRAASFSCLYPSGLLCRLKPFPNLPLFFSTVRWRHREGRIYLGQRPQLAQEPWGTEEF